MFHATLLFGILAITLGLFIWGYWRYDIVALIALIAAVLTGIIPFDKVFIGLANPAVITVACVMIISSAITQSGILDLIIKRLTPVTSHRIWHIGSLTLITAVFSAFMNNVGALTLFAIGRD